MEVGEVGDTGVAELQVGDGNRRWRRAAGNGGRRR
jgi:hypothetical protein